MQMGPCGMTIPMPACGDALQAAASTAAYGLAPVVDQSPPDAPTTKGEAPPMISYWMAQQREMAQQEGDTMEGASSGATETSD